MLKNKWGMIVGIIILSLGLAACSNATNTGEKFQEDNDVPTKQTEDQSEDRVHNDELENSNNDEEKNHTTEQTSNILEKIEDPSIAVLVNKQYSLGEDYVPDDLVTVRVPTVLENPEVKQLRKVAADALYDMFAKAKESGIYLYARSGYRSYQTQVQLFNNYVERHGEEAANRYSAKPGYSEHQTGLVMDVTSESVNFQLDNKFGETKEGKWLSEHAHEFGFIIRYPKGKEDITGYIYEPWHIRYLGVDLATEVFESGLSYEEYLEKEGIIHEVNS